MDNTTDGKVGTDGANPSFVTNLETNRQTLNIGNFNNSQPQLIPSEKVYPKLDLGDEEKLAISDPIAIPRGRLSGTRTTPCSSPSANMSLSGGIGSPCGSTGSFSLHIPSPIITKRTRTASTCERAMENPIEKGKIKYFCRTKGHGFITSDNGGDDIFVHISDIEGEYVPKVGDEVTFRLCAIPPKAEKFQAIHVRITHYTPDVHLKWDSPVEEVEKANEAAPNNLVT